MNALIGAGIAVVLAIAIGTFIALLAAAWIWLEERIGEGGVLIVWALVLTAGFGAMIGAHT